MSNRDELVAVFVGFIVGLLSGAGVALLFAPQSGEQTRAQIKVKSVELRDKAIESAEASAASARTWADEIARQLHGHRSDVTNEVPEPVGSKVNESDAIGEAVAM